MFLVLSPPARGGPGEGPDCNFPEEIDGCLPTPAPIRGVPYLYCDFGLVHLGFNMPLEGRVGRHNEAYHKLVVGARGRHPPEGQGIEINSRLRNTASGPEIVYFRSLNGPSHVKTHWKRWPVRLR